jgi:hypothetical protein
MGLSNLFSDDLRTSRWLGKVIDNQDPDYEGKIKVRVFGKFDDISDEDLPWARPCVMITGGSATGSGFHSVPKVDSVVGISFDNGDLYELEYFYLQHISDDLKNEIQNSYQNAHSLIYDTEVEGGIKILIPIIEVLDTTNIDLLPPWKRVDTTLAQKQADINNQLNTISQNSNGSFDKSFD